MDQITNSEKRSFEKLQTKQPTISFEFFPPKSSQGWAGLYSTLGEVTNLNLDFVSVTYGAGGSTREKTVSLVGRIQNELGIETMAHLTCVGHSQDELKEILSLMKQQNVKAIMALRGDPPQGETNFKPHPDGFAHGSDLIKFIKENFDFTIGCACYPEKHLESDHVDQDIEYLKLKQDNGADFGVTQLFFDNDDFYRFRDKAIQAGVTMPLVAGIMPVSNLKQLDRFKQMCGCTIPQKLIDCLSSAGEGDVIEKGIQYALDQCLDLMKNGIAGIHLYTLNKWLASKAITDGLRSHGFFPES